MSKKPRQYIQFYEQRRRKSLLLDPISEYVLIKVARGHLSGHPPMVREIVHNNEVASHATINGRMQLLAKRELIALIPISGRYPRKHVTLTVNGLEFLRQLDRLMADLSANGKTK